MIFIVISFHSITVTDLSGVFDLIPLLNYMNFATKSLTEKKKKKFFPITAHNDDEISVEKSSANDKMTLGFYD